MDTYVYKNIKKQEQIYDELINLLNIQKIPEHKLGDSYTIFDDKFLIMIEKKYTSIKLYDTSYNAKDIIKVLKTRK